MRVQVTSGSIEASRRPMSTQSKAASASDFLSPAWTPHVRLSAHRIECFERIASVG
jgi:hypothetical protein